jgi:pyrroline-5-carboxylate reductase
MKTKPILTLIGCGKMGSAMLRGWRAVSIAEKIFVIEPNGLPDEFHNLNDVIQSDASSASDIFILAVKPQIMNEVCASIHPAPDTLILSIAAGQKITGFEKHFGSAQPVIRAMPNTPAAIGQGITVATANQNVTPAQKDLARSLLSAIGLVEWLEDESLMDAVTALSGSGPAYVFHLIEVLAAAGAKQGLPPDLAMRLARQTVIGSAALAAAEPDINAEILRKNVTSPGGTTEAALNVLMKDKALEELFTRALNAATARSKELSS